MYTVFARNPDFTVLNGEKPCSYLSLYVTIKEDAFI
jgi:hypothetical protein